MSVKLVLTTICVTAVSMAAAYAPGLELVYSLERQTQGIFISADGRKFLSQRYSNSSDAPPQAVELLPDNTTVLYPDAAWNSYNASDPASDPTTSLVSLDGARIGPDGRFWLVDGGAAGVNHSSKLVGVNLTTNEVDRLYYLDDIIAADSNADDVRFSANQEVGYLSDTSGALLVLNLTTGDGVRVLADAASAQGWYPMMFNHTLIPGVDGPGSTFWAGLDQIEVSPDGVWLYYQPCNGGLWRIETQYLDASLTNATLAAALGDYAEAVALTPSSGGTTIDADGNIYVSDTNLLAVWKITPSGYASILVQDDALLWTDLMWITADKKLWLPASQVRPGLDGVLATGPNYIFTFPIDSGPSPIDHA
ncbi:hypothetical protein BX600DRAFT_486777 [Xylariales sp. PMI_506]|nr:hypothetical protein BX600DRAFT_486777 [Xylariales sp. PMI_506]